MFSHALYFLVIVLKGLRYPVDKNTLELKPRLLGKTDLKVLVLFAFRQLNQQMPKSLQVFSSNCAKMFVNMTL